MFIYEAKKILQDKGYKVIMENNDDEEEFIGKLRQKVLNFAKKVSFKVDKEWLETVLFEAYDKGWDMETAFKQVWKSVYTDPNESILTNNVESGDFGEFLVEYRTKGSLNKKTLAKMKDEKKPIEIPDDENYFEQSEAYIQKWYKVFNEKYFNNELKMPPFKWRSIKSYVGQCCCSFNIYTQKIVCDVINLNKKRLTNFKTFRNTLVHEMVHQWQHELMPDEEIRYANSVCGRAATRDWWKFLCLTQDGGHADRWLKKATELNEKFPELNITRFNNSETINNMDDEGNISKEYVDKLANSHLLTIESAFNSKKYVTFIDDETYNKLLQDLEDGKYRALFFFEYDFDPEKLKNYGLQPKNDINYGYKWRFFNELCKNGAVNKYHYTRLKKS